MIAHVNGVDYSDDDFITPQYSSGVPYQCYRLLYYGNNIVFMGTNGSGYADLYRSTDNGSSFTVVSGNPQGGDTDINCLAKV
jgi:hypothetical protein